MNETFDNQSTNIKLERTTFFKLRKEYEKVEKKALWTRFSIFKLGNERWIFNICGSIDCRRLSCVSV